MKGNYRESTSSKQTALLSKSFCKKNIVFASQKTTKNLLTAGECNKTHHWAMNATTVECVVFAIAGFWNPPHPKIIISNPGRGGCAIAQRTP